VAGGGLAIDRDAGGQFHIQAMVNDQPLRMLVDTGADGLALSEADAQSIGVMPDPASFAQVVTTASGPGYGAHVRIDRLELGGRDLGAIDAVVVRGLGTSLLGQSVLRRLGSVTITGDRMIVGN
jgi:aspartyl protease family protein